MSTAYREENWQGVSEVFSDQQSWLSDVEAISAVRSDRFSFVYTIGAEDFIEKAAHKVVRKAAADAEKEAAKEESVQCRAHTRTREEEARVLELLIAWQDHQAIMRRFDQLMEEQRQLGFV